MFILPEAKLRPELTALMAEAELERRRRNVATLQRALEARGDEPGITPRIILNILNSLALSTYSSNRRVTEQDFRQVIAKLLQRAEAGEPR